MLKSSKQKWSCNKCENETNTKIYRIQKNVLKKNLGVTCFNDNLKGLADSMHFMSD